MSLSDLTDQAAVTKALDEFDHIGRDEFLAKYGFSRSKEYFLRRNGTLYDSKAVVGAAYGYQYPDKGPLHPNDFSGGQYHVQRLLDSLGFEVIVQPPDGSPIQEHSSNLTTPAHDRTSFAELFTAFLNEFAKARTGPFQKVEGLWSSMAALKTRIERFAAVQDRPDLNVSISVGQGNWANVPWIALLNSNVTGSTQEGVYVVFLIAKNLDQIYLTLNQGATNLVKDLGQARAQEQMVSVADTVREQIADLQTAGYTLDNEIDLAAGGWLSKNYEIGTIAHVEFGADSIPDDERIHELLESLLEAYDRIATPFTVTQEHFKVAETFGIGKTFSTSDFKQRYKEKFPERADGSILPADYTFQDRNKSRLQFLSYIAREKYEFRGLSQPAEQRATEGDTDKDDSMNEEITPQPTNLILFGPPGTGKTFNTAVEAVLLCDGVVPEGGRPALMARYRNLIDRKRIEFVTFHQSYSYEDFVEGLRPETGSLDGDEVDSAMGFRLAVREGIFQAIADRAAANRGAPLEPPMDYSNRQAFKMSLGRSFRDEEAYLFEEAIQGGYISLGYGGEIDWSGPSFDSFEAIKERWQEEHPDATGNDPNIQQTYSLRSYMRLGDIVIASDGNKRFRAIGEISGPYRYVERDRDHYYHQRPVKWLWHDGEGLPVEEIYSKAFSQVSVYRLSSDHVKWPAIAQIIASGSAERTEGRPEPYVLIIDEVNRANISKVFGELITLIEPDKRLGMTNALTVTLPYSGKSFGVPANLHILGTMNTADRSIALLDTALRRRFHFQELLPNLNLLDEDIEGVNVRAVLRSLNARIEYLFDRDHQIGHAYFLECKTRDELEIVMRTKVIPLLAEYFYEDWEKVRMVLNETNNDGAFINRQQLSAPNGWAGDTEFDVDRWRYSVKDKFSVDAFVQLS